MGMFNSLSDQLNQKHPLYILANRINWQVFEDSFSKIYSKKMGRECVLSECRRNTILPAISAL